MAKKKVFATKLNDTMLNRGLITLNTKEGQNILSLMGKNRKLRSHNVAILFNGIKNNSKIAWIDRTVKGKKDPVIQLSLGTTIAERMKNDWDYNKFPDKSTKTLNQFGTLEGYWEGNNTIELKFNVTEDGKKYYKAHKIPRNKIWFGAPGTGKSYKLSEETKRFLGEEKFETNHERVTFHPDYSYANFVGTYKPIMTKVEGEDNISYKYVPGPFMRVLVKALNNPKQNFVLIIEEINRANTAAVFGDIFQLLDRNSYGDSEYPIAVSEDIKYYLEDGNLNDGAKKKLKACTDLIIPSNMYIWATMNSADQGVFPMDTAFKRRWDFEYMDINAGEEEIADIEFKVNDNTVNWNNIRKAINDALAEQKINEDKLMGGYFLSKSLLESKDNEQFISAFKSKVLMYLYEDAAKMKREQIFFEAGKRYSKICEKFDTDGIKVFSNDIQDKYNKLKSQSDEQNNE